MGEKGKPLKKKKVVEKPTAAAVETAVPSAAKKGDKKK